MKANKYCYFIFCYELVLKINLYIAMNSMKRSYSFYAVEKKRFLTAHRENFTEKNWMKIIWLNPTKTASN